MRRLLLALLAGAAGLAACRTLSEKLDCDGEGIANGARVYTYPNGTTKSKVDVTECRCNGTTTTYRPDGSKRSSGSCKEGRYGGIFNQFNRAGAVIGSQSWREGSLTKVTAFGSRKQLDFYPGSLVVADATTADSLMLPKSARDNQYTWFFEPGEDGLFLLASGRNAYIISDSLQLLELRTIAPTMFPQELDIVDGLIQERVVEIRGFVPLDTTLKVVRIPLP
jgi:hypothetical protein